MEIKILEFTIYNNKVLYTIQLKEINSIVNFKSRYSTLYEIHKELKKINHKKNFPNFPKKKLFGSKKIDFLQKRQIELEEYLNLLIKGQVYTLTPFKNYINKIKKKNNNNINDSGICIGDHKEDNVDNLKSKTDMLNNKINKNENNERIQKEIQNKIQVKNNINMDNIYKNFQIKILNFQKFSEFTEESEDERKNKVFIMNKDLLNDCNKFTLNPQIFESLIESKNEDINENISNKEENEENKSFKENLNLYLQELDILDENFSKEVLNNSTNIIHIKV